MNPWKKNLGVGLLVPGIATTVVLCVAIGALGWVALARRDRAHNVQAKAYGTKGHMGVANVLMVTVR